MALQGSARSSGIRDEKVKNVWAVSTHEQEAEVDSPDLVGSPHHRSCVGAGDRLGKGKSYWSLQEYKFADDHRRGWLRSSWTSEALDSDAFTFYQLYVLQHPMVIIGSSWPLLSFNSQKDP